MGSKTYRREDCIVKHWCQVEPAKLCSSSVHLEHHVIRVKSHITIAQCISALSPFISMDKLQHDLPVQMKSPVQSSPFLNCDHECRCVRSTDRNSDALCLDFTYVCYHFFNTVSTKLVVLHNTYCIYCPCQNSDVISLFRHHCWEMSLNVSLMSPCLSHYIHVTVEKRGSCCFVTESVGAAGREQQTVKCLVFLLTICSL